MVLYCRSTHQRRQHMTDQAPMTSEQAFTLLSDIFKQLKIELQKRYPDILEFSASKKQNDGYNVYILSLNHGTMSEDGGLGPSLTLTINDDNGLPHWIAEVMFDEGAWHLTSIDEGFEGRRLDLKGLTGVRNQIISQEEAIQLARRMVLFYQSL